MASPVTRSSLSNGLSFTPAKGYSKELDSTDSKTHALVVFGHVLEFASLASMIAVFPMAFAHGVVVLCAIPFCVIVFSMGTALKEENLLPQDAYVPPHIRNSGPRIAGQPVPLINSAQNCWLSAAMQCIVHVDVLRQRVLELNNHVLTEWIGEYQRLQASGDPISPMSMQGLIALFEQSGTEDPAEVVFGTLLRHKPLYQLTQTKSRGAVSSESQTTSEILIKLETPRPDRLSPEHAWNPGRLDVVHLLNGFFSSETEEGDQIRKQFLALPETLAVRVNRYYHTGRNTTYATHMLRKPIEKINNVFQIGSSQYMTDAFMIYTDNHYYACVYKEGKWWKCDDTRINEISAAQALEWMNYSCFFFANRRA